MAHSPPLCLALGAAEGAPQQVTHDVALAAPARGHRRTPPTRTHGSTQGTSGERQRAKYTRAACAQGLSPVFWWRRARISGYKENESFFEAYADFIDEPAEEDKELDALARSVVSQFEQYIKLNKKIPPEVLVSVNQIDNSSKLADTVASHLTLKIAEKQELLEIKSVSERLERVYGFMESEISVLQVERRIRNRVKRQMEKTQREYYLNEQMKAIQR
ncbi:MAG: LON peptidase substrate-binding domain-containing protein, partial [Rhodospirillaceae bacterium]